MKIKALFVVFCLLLTGCKISMDDCYRAIYDYVGPQGADTFTMEVTQKGTIKDLSAYDDEMVAWIQTEPEMWVEMRLPLDVHYEVGDRVIVSMLVKFQRGGKLDIIQKRIE